MFRRFRRAAMGRRGGRCWIRRGAVCFGREGPAFGYQLSAIRLARGAVGWALLIGGCGGRFVERGGIVDVWFHRWIESQKAFEAGAAGEDRLFEEVVGDA